MNIIKRLRLPSFSTVNQPCGKVFIWNDKKPKKIDLPQNAKRVSIGSKHTAIIGQSGNLYTYGQNNFGQLGQGNTTKTEEPKLVEYFQQKDIKVKEAICGELHTIVLGENGKVYTFGYGGKKSNLLSRMFVNYTGALGHQVQQNILTPKRVKSLKDEEIVRITAGSKFNTAVTKEGKVYNWGNGEYGVFGNGSNKSTVLPQLNDYFTNQTQTTSIGKVKSCSTFSIAIMKSGYLYGWGSNHAGQMGIENQIGIQLHEMVNYPAEMKVQDYLYEVVNFDISENVTIFQVKNGTYWWTGASICYSPKQIQVQDAKIKLFAAGYKSYGLVSTDNTVYSFQSFFPTSKDADIKTGIVKMNGSELFDGEIVGIGGQYNTRYAIVK